MYLDTSPKITVGCRMSAELREQLEEEARNAGETLSAHIESLLIRRVNVHVDVNDLKMRLFQLEAENAELKQKQPNNAGEINPASPDHLALATAVRSLKSQKLELVEQLRRITAERDALARFQSTATPPWLSDTAYREVLNYLEKIWQQYPKADYEQILVSSLAVTWKNIKNLLFVYTLEDYWKRFPLTLKKSNEI